MKKKRKQIKEIMDFVRTNRHRALFVEVYKCLNCGNLIITMPSVEDISYMLGGKIDKIEYLDDVQVIHIVCAGCGGEIKLLQRFLPYAEDEIRKLCEKEI